jgi:signal transduction histidine kinase
MIGRVRFAKKCDTLYPQMRLSIRYKILAVTGLLLLLAIGSYTWLASFIFTEQKTALLFDINHSIAVNSAAQIRSSLNQVSDQLKLFAVSRLLAGKTDFRLPATTLKDNNILAMGLFKKDGEHFDPQKLPTDVPAIAVDETVLTPHLLAAEKNGMEFWRAPTPAGTSFFYLASRLEITLAGKTDTYLTLAGIDGKPFFEMLHSASIFESFLMKPNGDVLVHVQEQNELAPDPQPDHPLLEAQRKPTALSGVQSYEFKGSRRYGAFAPVGLGGLFYISQADESEVTSALAVLLQRSLLFGVIVLTLTFIASILFSKTLTRNLQFLTGGAIAIGEGNLTSHIQVKSGDEVETLANSFNQMVDALRASREAIETYNRELEGKVAARTQELRETNAAIKDVQEKLLQTSQLAAVGEVAGQTAHELLNPLTAIISRLERSKMSVQTAGGTAAQMPAQLMEILHAWKDDFLAGGVAKLAASLQSPSTAQPGKTLGEEDLENLEKLGKYWTEQSGVVSSDLDFVRDQAQRIHRIVDKMRELIRSSVKSEVTCREAVQEAVATMADFMEKHGVKLSLDWQAHQDLAELNRDELIQIMTNLMRNAFQAVGEAGRSGTVTVRSQDQNGILTVDVMDNGVGISAANQKNIFDQGFTTKGPAEGTGLGLAICRRYARAFGGEVALVSSSPEGTTFRVTIPLKRQEAVA